MSGTTHFCGIPEPTATQKASRGPPRYNQILKDSDEIPITTKSDEARAFFFRAQDQADLGYRDKARDLVDKAIRLKPGTGEMNPPRLLSPG